MLGPGHQDRIQMVVALRFFTPESPESWDQYVAWHSTYAQVIPIGDPDTGRQPAATPFGKH